jgi:hypothetical protein
MKYIDSVIVNWVIQHFNWVPLGIKADNAVFIREVCQRGIVYFVFKRMANILLGVAVFESRRFELNDDVHTPSLAQNADDGKKRERKSHVSCIYFFVPAKQGGTELGRTAPKGLGGIQKGGKPLKNIRKRLRGAKDPKEAELEAGPGAAQQTPPVFGRINMKRFMRRLPCSMRMRYFDKLLGNNSGAWRYLEAAPATTNRNSRFNFWTKVHQFDRLLAIFSQVCYTFFKRA